MLPEPLILTERLMIDALPFLCAGGLFACALYAVVAERVDRRREQRKRLVAIRTKALGEASAALLTPLRIATMTLVAPESSEDAKAHAANRAYYYDRARQIVDSIPRDRL